MVSWKLKDLRNVEKFALSVFLLTIFQHVFGFVDFFLDLVFGYTITNGWRKDRKRAEDDYEHSAQIVNILFKGVYSFTEDVQLDNFLYRHVKYVHPRHILENDNVLLYGVTPTHAFFSVTHDQDKNILDMEKAPFMFVFTLMWTEQLVIVPLKTFHRLASELGDPDGREVTLMDMTGRCGSTLIGQILNTVPNVRTLSEPWALVFAQSLHTQGKLTRPELRQIVRSCMRLQCKPENKTKIDKIFIKQSHLVTHLQPMIQELFPKFKFIFNFRHYSGVLTSWLKLGDSIGMPAFFRYSSLRLQFLIGHAPLPLDDEKWISRRKEMSTLEDPEFENQGTLLVYVANMLCFERNKKNYGHVILFEELMADPAGHTKRLFEFLGIGLDRVDAALKVLKSDSQNGLFGGIGNSKIHITQKNWDEMDVFLKECGIPMHKKSTVEDLRKLFY